MFEPVLNPTKVPFERVRRNGKMALANASGDCRSRQPLGDRSLHGLHAAGSEESNARRRRKLLSPVLRIAFTREESEKTKAR